MYADGERILAEDTMHVTEAIHNMKEKEERIRAEVGEKTLSYITAAFGFVAGLAWNDAVKGLIEYWYPAEQGGLLAKFIYALILTILLVVVTVLLARFLKRQES